MEKRNTPTEARRERFNREAKIARDLAQLAMDEVDEALAESSELFQRWAGPSKKLPITDSDTLASPIGYYEPPQSIVD